MTQNLISNNKSFKRFLKELDPETLGVYGWRFVYAIDMRLRLDDDDLELAYFIAENYDDMDPYLCGDDAYLLYNLENYLFRLPEEDMRDLYHDYVDLKFVMEDLMGLPEDDRISLMAHHHKCDREELERFDRVWLN
jgi:hypothetical protein